jgi:AAA family ATP:ADP antiporter
MNIAERKIAGLPIGSFILICLIAPVLVGSYGIAHPVVDSIFTEAYGAEAFPWAWLATAPMVTVTVLVYNRISAHVTTLALLQIAAIVSGALLIGIIAALWMSFSWAPFLLYLWKDIYIVVLIETFWVFANSTFPVANAKWLYGFFCAVGSLGTIAGSALLAFTTPLIGNIGDLILLLPLFLIVAMTAGLLARNQDHKVVEEKQKTAFSEAFHVVRRSKYLGSLLGMVAVVQVTITLIDYQYKVALEAAFPIATERTVIAGEVYGLINTMALLLQSASGPILITVGVPLTLLAIPTVLGTTLGAFSIAPTFAMMKLTKIASKSMDYSLFRAAKEILYIPLGAKEKTQGKAVIDILGYRVAKAFASGILLAVTSLGLGTAVVPVTFFGICCWGFLTTRVARKYAAQRNEQP